ncbi:gliding motility-associated C-terminal domain-containing protein, partial [Crocinitomicaceae bacterium]|nr:gliding motility-associated C-terminal domain-containing protein [Crocinitomicaceae bacterium]
YTIQVIDTNGCIEEQTYLVDQPSAPVAIADTSGNISCFGGNDGFIDITVTGGNGGYSFDWSNAALTEDLTDLFVGVYVVEVEDSLGCFASDTITLTEPLAPLSLTTDMTAVLCFSEANGIASVSASGGTAPYTYLWSNAETTDTITGLLIGDYTVFVTDSLGCIDSAVVTVTEPPVLTAVADSVDVLCFGDATGSVTVTAQGGMLVYDYLWDTGDITATVTDLPAGLYEVTVTDTNGCTFSTNTTINQPLAPLSDTLIIADNLCFGESLGSIDATISGGTIPYDYSWSNGETTEDIDSLANGSYTLTVTDDNMCVLVIDTIITSPTEIDITHVQTNVSCFGGNDATIDLTVGGAMPPYSYLWNTADTLQDLDSLFVGTYDVIITDSNNCEDPYTVTITEPLAPLALSADSINVACFGDSTGAIDLTVTGGTIAYSFSWSNGEVTEDIIDIPTGTYQVIVTDDNLCVDSLSMFIDQPAAPIALSATQVDILCFGDFTGEIDLTVTGGTPATTGYVYDWNTGLSIDEDLTGLPFGTYDVLVTDSLFCSDSLTVTLTQPAAPIDIEFTILNVACFGDSTGDVSAVISGGTGPYTWFWDFPIVDTTLFIDSLPADGYVLNVLDSNNCTYGETAVITQPAGPLTSAYADVQPSCFEYEDGSLTLIPSGGTPDYSYLWNTGDTTLSIDSLTTGDYSVEIYDALGCYFALDIFLDEPPELQISLDVDSLAGCSPFTVAFTNTSNATADCEWDFGDGNTFSGCEEVVNIYEEGGIYSVSLTAYDDNGCFNDVTYNDFITVYQTPTADMNIDPQVLFPETPTTDITNTSTGASMYVWNMGDSPQDYGFFEPGAYTYSPNVQDTFVVTLLVISDDGCTDSTSDIVIFRNDPFFFAPNSFTPDGNNLNEVWIPVFSSPDYVDRYDLQVYNRWGGLVFGTDQVTQGWNGMVDNSGNIAQDGVYTWKMSFKWYDQRTYQLTGHITLIR